MTEEQKELYNASMYDVKYGENEIDVIKGAKYILNNHMDLTGMKTILMNYQTSVLDAKGNTDELYKAEGLVQASMLNIIAQLFVNTYRMGMLEVQNEMKTLLEQNTTVNEIGTPAKEEE